MSKVNNNGFLSGHTGNMVFREVNGRQIVQSMPSHYRDAKTESQLKQRSGMRNILATYRLLKDAIKSQFEDAVGTFPSTSSGQTQLSTSPHRPYDCFKHHNLLLPAVELSKKDYDIGLAVPAPYIVSHGSLPTLEQTVVDGCLQFQLISEDWKKGDILRLIRAKSKDGSNNKPTYLHGSYSDIIINDITERQIVSEPLTHGAYTYVHLRQTSKGVLVPTQQLIVV